MGQMRTLLQQCGKFTRHFYYGALGLGLAISVSVAFSHSANAEIHWRSNVGTAAKPPQRPYPESVSPKGEAPRQGMLPGRWSSGNKQFVGTAFESYDSKNKFSEFSATAPISKTWFTASQGVLTEVFWPTIDTPQIRDSQFLITDGKTFFSEERKSTQSSVTWLASGVPAFHVVNRDPKNRFTIEKTIFSDPDRNCVIQRVRISRYASGLKFFLLHNPAVENSPLGDSAVVSVENGGISAPGAGLFAWQGEQAQAVVFSLPLRTASAAFSGPFDGYQDLSDDFQLNQAFERASNGNVVLTAEMEIPDTVGTTEFDIVLGFGDSIGSAFETAQKTLNSDLSQTLSKFSSQWKNYQASIRDLGQASTDQGKLFRASVAVLKSFEDKTHEGAFVASPTVPWGEHQWDGTGGGSSLKNSKRPRQKMTGGYHLVWPRDLYMMATTMMAIEDYGSAIASLNRLRAVQHTANDGDWFFSFRQRSKDGSFPQNFWVNGEVYWQGLQIDETAMPVILAYRLWQAGKIDLGQYWNMVQRAADFIVEFGPWSAQERWEESFGASPSTIAAEITALWVAADMAKAMGDSQRENRYRAHADSWSSKPGDNVTSWTFTQSGGHGNGRYFVRVDGGSFFEQAWDPNDNAEYYIANNGGAHREKDILDGGFLELVRFGVRSPMDTAILETLPEYDQTLRVDVLGRGPSFRRYVADRYNYDDASGTQTAGMLWPLLTGERGHYELAYALESHQKPLEADAAITPYIRAMQGFATPSLMLPEQVWDGGAYAGQSTGSATPLGWTHGEYIKLLRSRQDREVFDRIGLVYERALALSKLGSQGSRPNGFRR